MMRRGAGTPKPRKQRRHAVSVAAALAVLSVACSPVVEDGEGSFESGPGGSGAGEDDDGDDEGSTGEDTGAGAVEEGPAAICVAYLSCLGALTSDQFSTMQAEFGEGGTCYDAQPVQTCESQCNAALEALTGALGPAAPVECGGSATGPENSDATCSDGVDNDGDGFIDCDDPACTDIGVSVCINTDENTDANCADGIDNDGDGFIDCDDFDCAPPFVTVCSLTEDNPAACADGVDNDGDGFVDCDDFDCSMNSDINCGVDEGPEDTNARCDDNQDNDGDGFIDCDDFDCSMNPDVTVC